eukprot:TRINITY_DN9942_c0_g1_i1.p1 TRINITY_DN9942_c0_g1~~TRINITY_DN9942_c0_g1_i1.p1  ORF type:complete len:1084 (+),score=253.01 TRINITY_DN9942_c0_g1_i1:40-3291(+)
MPGRSAAAAARAGRTADPDTSNPLLSQLYDGESSSPGSPWTRKKPKSKRLFSSPDMSRLGLTVSGVRQGLLRNVRDVGGKTANFGGKVLGDLGGAVSGAPIVLYREAKQEEPAGPLSAEGYEVECVLLKDFLMKVAGDVAERPRKMDWFLYAVTLVAVTITCLLNVSLSNERFMYEMQRSLELGLYGGANFDSEIAAGTFLDISDASEVWAWLEGPFVENFWPSAQSSFGTQMVVESNHIIGPVVIRQFRALEEKCSNMHGLASNLRDELLREPCIVDGSFSVEPYGVGNVFISDRDRSKAGVTWDTLLLPMVRDIRTKHSTFGSGDHVYTVLIPSQGSRADAQSKISWLKNNSWIDHRTRAVVLEGIVFNRNVDSFLTMSAWIEVTSTGHYISNHRLRPFKVLVLAAPGGVSTFCLDITLALSALAGSVRLIRKVFHVWLIRRSPVYMITFWNVVQILVFVLLCYTCAMRFYLFYLAETFSSSWPTDSTIATSDITDQWVDLMSYSSTFHTVLQLIGYTACLVWLWGVAFLEHMPKLALLTETVHSAFSELFGVLVLLFFMMMAFTLMVSLLYGHSMDTFSTFGRSMSTLFQIALDFGNLQYVPMEFVEPRMTSFILVVFTFLIWVLILNMLLAVITEAFVRTARERRSTDRLDMQLMIRGLVKTGRKMTQNVVRACRSLFRCGSSNPDATVKFDGKEDEELQGALFGALDEVVQLEINYFRTVSTVPKLLLLARTINGLGTWRHEHGQYIPYEKVSELPAIGGETEPGSQLTKHQMSLLERFFLLRGRPVANLREQDDAQPAVEVVADDCAGLSAKEELLAGRVAQAVLDGLLRGGFAAAAPSEVRSETADPGDFRELAEVSPLSLGSRTPNVQRPADPQGRSARWHGRRLHDSGASLASASWHSSPASVRAPAGLQPRRHSSPDSPTKPANGLTFASHTSPLSQRQQQPARSLSDPQADVQAPPILALADLQAAPLRDTPPARKRSDRALTDPPLARKGSDRDKQLRRPSDPQMKAAAELLARDKLQRKGSDPQVKAPAAAQTPTRTSTPAAEQTRAAAPRRARPPVKTVQEDGEVWYGV